MPQYRRLVNDEGTYNEEATRMDQLIDRALLPFFRSGANPRDVLALVARSATGLASLIVLEDRRDDMRGRQRIAPPIIDDAVDVDND